MGGRESVDMWTSKTHEEKHRRELKECKVLM